LDEAPITFDMLNPTIIEKCGTRISFRTAGNEMKNFTMIFGCIADETKLKIYPKKAIHLNGIFYSCK